MRYVINKKRFKMRDLRMMVNGDPEACMRVMAACAVDNNDEPLDKDEVFAVLDEMDAETWTEEMERFGVIIEEANRKAVPLAGAKK